MSGYTVLKNNQSHFNAILKYVVSVLHRTIFDHILNIRQKINK